MAGTNQETPVQPTFVAVGGIIIDDIVMPNGETHMEVLGGAVVHAAAGMWVWDQRPGILAHQGTDLPAAVYQRLSRDFDLRGLVPLGLPQARAWQVFEWDGRRTEVFRVSEMEPFVSGPLPTDMPPVYHDARGIYLLRDATQIAEWRKLNPAPVIFWEPMQQFMTAANQEAFRSTLEHVNIVSPNWLEARQVYGFDDPARLVRAMLDDGAPVVALRMGEEGSLLGQQSDARLVKVPAVPVESIVDQTGAGNTYCGGFLVGWVTGGDLKQAGCFGAVAASFALENTGKAEPPSGWQAVRDQRYQWVRANVAYLANED